MVRPETMPSVGDLGRFPIPTLVPHAPLTSSPFSSLPSSRLGPEGALSLSQALDGCPYVEEVR